jgi:hypothetical protein
MTGTTDERIRRWLPVKAETDRTGVERNDVADEPGALWENLLKALFVTAEGESIPYGDATIADLKAEAARWAEQVREARFMITRQRDYIAHMRQHGAERLRDAPPWSAR